jgi:actin-related protein
MAAGRLSGLVVDVGHLETTVTPVSDRMKLHEKIIDS